MGRGPFKYGTGEHKSILCYSGHPCRVEQVRVRVGEGLLVAGKLGDVRLQAMTRGGREMDCVLRGRAVFKDVTAASGMGLATAASALGIVAMAQSAAAASATSASAAGGASASGAGAAATGASMAIPIVGLGVAGGALVFLAVSAATNPAADIRHWETLPDCVHVAEGKLPPGKHRLEIECLGRCCGPVGGFAAVSKEITIEPGHETVVVVRAGPFESGGAAHSPGLVAQVPMSQR